MSKAQRTVILISINVIECTAHIGDMFGGVHIPGVGIYNKCGMGYISAQDLSDFT
jgi:hypothetical protein